jgi:mannosidase alpha-like ER degradation enhancer 2
LWQTFKQTMEMTSSALSSSHKTSPRAEPEHPQNARTVLSSRRIALVQKTLQDHYTQQLVDSFPHWDNYHTQQKEEDSQAAKIQSNARQANRRALRWKEGKESGCYFFTESIDAYWSFQWCPLGYVMQGFRTKEIPLNAQHLLGSFAPLILAGSIGTRDYAQKFAREAQLKYPNAQRLELYHNGDPCGKMAAVSSNRRMTVVVHHDRSSRFCAGDWVDSLTDLAIESVEEPQECRYLIHVCGPPTSSQTTATSYQDDDETIEKSSTAKRRPITQSDANKLNQTITQIQQSLQTYLRESSADTRRKTNPDRTTSLHIGLPPLPQSRIQSNLKLLRNMFQHAYDSYMYNAFPASDIKPMTCQPASFNLVRIPGLTLIDSLDTLVVFGNYTEFARAVERLRGLHKQLQEENGRVHGGGGLFALNQNVSVFETNIRVLGGLLSAHQMAEAYLSKKVLKQDVWSPEDKTVLVGTSPTTPTTMPETECPTSDDDDDGDESSNVDKTSLPNQCSVASSLLECESSTTAEPKATTTCRNSTLKFWEYDGILLELAQDIGDRLLPAFETKTGIPYGTVNLLTGIPPGETTIASLAGGGTLSLEMELLSRMTGNPEYGKAAKLATRALWMRRSELGLVGKHICTHRGEWTETLSGIGSNSDSFYEYLIKHHTLFPEDYDFWLQLVSTYGGIYNESRLGEWYGDVDYFRGQSNGGGNRRVFEALMAFYPGMQVLLGELTPAGRSLNSFFLVREHLGFLPERFNYAFWKVDPGGGHHFLRPELLESAYFQHQASKGFQQQFRNSSIVDSSGWQWAADFALHAIEESAKTVCGYASLKSVSPTTTGDIRGQGHAKTTSNMMNEMPSFFLSETLKYLYLMFDENNVLHTDKDRDWVFTTEAHPIHHVDASREDQKLDELVELKGRLVEKLQARVQGTNPGKSTSNGHEKGNKWTDSSSSKKYFKQAGPIALDVENKSRSQLIASERASHGPEFWQTTHIVEPLVSASQVYVELDFFHETQQKQNAAHLTFGRLGNRIALTNSCPNFYLSDWRWICALNGGGADYSDAYVSSAMDKSAPGESQFLMVGSIDALAFYGSGVHVAELYDESQKCPIVHRQESSSETDTSRPKEVGQLKDTFDMGGELGKFEVSAFPEGSGFFIQRINSGETVAATLIYDETAEASQKPYVMVHATTPVDEENETGGESSGTEDRVHVEKSVVMADVAGNAFSCQVEVIIRNRRTSTDAEEGSTETCIGESGDDDWEEVIATYPCAPAMFGPAHMAELADRDGITIESTSVRRPDVNGGYGCQASSTEAADESQTNVAGAGSTGSINLVHRGVCTFEQKALIQKNSFHAEAVIVINSEEDELFVMSGGGASHPGPLSSSDFPPTVLITGGDGKDLFLLTESSMGMEEESKLLVRISITRDRVQIINNNNELSVRDNMFWPAVRAGPDAVQIFAKGGWAVHAVQRNADSKNAAVEWQLFLLSHNPLVQQEGEDL